jgi:nitrite reductase (NADH) small subunit
MSATVSTAALVATRSVALGSLWQIPLGEGRVFTVGERSFAVFRARDGGVHATDPFCPHRQGPLADGLVGAGTVTCPFHGFRFDLRTGCAIGHDCPPIATYRVSVDAYGDLHLHLD